MEFIKKYSMRDRAPLYFYPQPLFPVKPEITEGIFLNEESNKHGATIYIHIPFCVSICKYCSLVRTIINQDTVNHYVEALTNEIKNYASSQYVKGLTFSAIYFGGGTPTAIGIERLTKLIKLLFESFQIEKDYELTVEGTPRSFTEEMLKALYAVGVNRISMGVQTFNEEISKNLALPQNPNIALDVITRARNIGIKEINLDFMYDLPSQTPQNLLEDLNKAIAADVSHVSLFPLLVHRNSELYQAAKVNDELKVLLDDELDFQYYCQSAKLLEESGYIQRSPIDWFKEGHIFKFHQREEQLCEMVSLGVNSLGALNDIIYINHVFIDDYIKKMNSAPNHLPIGSFSSTKNTEHERFVIMKLKALKVSKSEYEKRFNESIMDRFGNEFRSLIEDELIVEDGDQLKFTHLGKFYFVNVIMDKFFREPYRSAQLLANFYYNRLEEDEMDI